jgi:hypothetical protein
MTTATNDNMTRKIQDIAPLLAEHFLDIEIDETTFKTNNKLVTDNSLRLGLYYKYLGLLHDNWFIETKISENNFSIILNDFTTHVFSDVLVSKKSLKFEENKLVFPIKIEFKTTNLSYNLVDEDGNIQIIEPISVDEYLYEQIIAINNEKIEIGIVVWKNGTEDVFGQQILILLTAKNVKLTEFQDKAWIEIFGNSYDNYYNYFKSQLSTGRYLSDQTLCYELYDEFERQINN